MAEFLLGDQTVAVLIPLTEEIHHAHLVLLQRRHDLLGHRNIRLQIDLEATQNRALPWRWHVWTERLLPNR